MALYNWPLDLFASTFLIEEDIAMNKLEFQVKVTISLTCIYYKLYKLLRDI